MRRRTQGSLRDVDQLADDLVLLHEPLPPGDLFEGKNLVDNWLDSPTLNVAQGLDELSLAAHVGPQQVKLFVPEEADIRGTLVA